MDKIHIFENFIEQEDCDLAVNFFNELKNQGKFNRMKDFRLTILDKNFETSDYIINKYLDKFRKMHNKSYDLITFFLSIYEPGSYIEPHQDRYGPTYLDSEGILFYFNDNFEGGELYFPQWDYEIKPKKGMAVIFPCSNPEYLHGVKETTSGIRYMIPIETISNEKILK